MKVQHTFLAALQGLSKIALVSSLVVAVSISAASTLWFAPQVDAASSKNGRYIVVLKSDTSDVSTTTSEMARNHGLSVRHTYKNSLKGFSASIPEGRLNALRNDSRIASITPDQEVYATAQTLPKGIDRVDAEKKSNTASGIVVAVLDSGIELSHPDLKANIIASKSCVSYTTSANDDYGHGTHVAGTVAGINNSSGVVGVAPKAKLIAVKVLDATGKGYRSDVICGIDWVTDNAAKHNIKVVNMSIGGTGTSDNNCGYTSNDSYHQAICRSVAKGLTYVVSAGNNASPTANQVPAAYNDAVITVSALADSDGKKGGFGPTTNRGADDTFATFSNYGPEVDIAAPGVSIYSTYKGKAYATMSGTSMATPHVAAAAALYLKKYPGATWTQIRDGLRQLAEPLNQGHTDPSGLHPEPVLNVKSL